MSVENPQAFPQPRYLDYNGREPGTYKGGNDGMTLRDYFAGQVITGMMAHPMKSVVPTPELVRYAYEIADAMLKARSNSND